MYLFWSSLYPRHGVFFAVISSDRGCEQAEDVVVVGWNSGFSNNSASGFWVVLKSGQGELASLQDFTFVYFLLSGHEAGSYGDWLMGYYWSTEVDGMQIVRLQLHKGDCVDFVPGHEVRSVWIWGGRQKNMWMRTTMSLIATTRLDNIRRFNHK